MVMLYSMRRITMVPVSFTHMIERHIPKERDSLSFKAQEGLHRLLLHFKNAHLLFDMLMDEARLFSS